MASWEIIPGDVQPAVIIDELSGISANSVGMGKTSDNPETGRTGDEYKGMEKSWIGGSRQSHYNVVGGPGYPLYWR
jgi:hypothetical protein